MLNQARLVIIGAGIAGCSAAYHLAQLGWRDMLVLDQGPLPAGATGGSTSHAPGGLSLISASRMLTDFAGYGVPLYARLSVDGRPGANLVGALEVARSEVRWAELKRRAGWGRSYGVECQLLSPQEGRDRVPGLGDRQSVRGRLTLRAG